MFKPDDDELLQRRVIRLETKMAAIIYLTKGAFTLLERMTAGEDIPIEQVQSLHQALDSLSPRETR